MYNVKSNHADEFIDDSEILETLAKIRTSPCPPYGPVLTITPSHESCKTIVCNTNCVFLLYSTRNTQPCFALRFGRDSNPRPSDQNTIMDSNHYSVIDCNIYGEHLPLTPSDIISWRRYTNSLSIMFVFLQSIILCLQSDATTTELPKH